MTANPGDGREMRAETPPQHQRPIPADILMVRLAIARMHAGHLTIREAAERCGLNYASWSNWEQGSQPRNFLDVIEAISAGLDVDHNWLMYGGPLSGARGMPTKRPGNITHGYSRVHVRPSDTRPDGRAKGGQHSAPPNRGEQRRPARISHTHAA